MSENSAMTEGAASEEAITVEKKSNVEKVASLFGGVWLCVTLLSLVLGFVAVSGADSVVNRQLDDELIVAGYDLGYNWTSDNITTFETKVRIDNNLIGADVDAKMYELQCSSGFVEACDYMFVREAVQDTSREEYYDAVSPFCGMLFVALGVSVFMGIWSENIRNNARRLRLQVHTAQ